MTIPQMMPDWVVNISIWFAPQTVDTFRGQWVVHHRKHALAPDLAEIMYP